MGWNGSGKVDRTNGDATGESVWQEDLAAGRLVTALRHDTHDEDLADAIEACVNIDGENTMAANLDMNGFNIVNIGSGNLDLVLASGAFTPTYLSGTATPTGVTYTTQVGRYYRFNDLIFVSVHIDVSDTGVATAANPITIGALPFTPASQGTSPNLNEFALALGEFDWSGALTTSTNYDQIHAVAQPLATGVGFYGGVAIRHTYDGNSTLLTHSDNKTFTLKASGLFQKVAS